MGTQPPPEEPQAPTPEPEPIAAESPWQTWEQAGWNPTEADPYQTREALRYQQAMTDRNYRPAVLMDTLRRGPEGQHIPEHWTYDDMLSAIQERAQREQMPDPSQFYDEQVGFDPNAFVQSVPQMVQAQVAQALAAERQQWQQQLTVRDMGNAMSDLARQHNLTPQDQQFLAPLAETFRQQGMPPQQAVAEAYRQAQAWRTAGQAQAIQQQGQAPNMGLAPGQTPAEHQGPPQNFRDAVNRGFGQ